MHIDLDKNAIMGESFITHIQELHRYNRQEISEGTEA